MMYSAIPFFFFKTCNVFVTMLIGMARGIPGGVRVSKKKLVVFLIGDVLGHSCYN